MPTLYEIFTLRWGAEKDARIAELETELREQAEAHVLTVEALEVMLAPFREYVAATEPEAPKAGDGDDGAAAGRPGQVS